MSAAEVVTADHSVKACDEIAATIAGLEAIAAWSKAHPDIPLTNCGATYAIGGLANSLHTPDYLVRAISDGARIGDVVKSAGQGDYETTLYVTRNMGGKAQLSYHAPRDEVCERVVTGTETVSIPDPAAPLVEVEREVVEWRCAPILGGEA